MEFVRPNQEVLVMKNSDGSVFFTAPAIDLDLLITKAAEGTDPLDPVTYDIRLDRFLSLLQENYEGIEFTRQDAWIINVKASEAMLSLKKNMTL